MGQFKALCYKNWVLYKRSIVGSVLEIAIPVIILLFLILTRSLVEITEYNEGPFLGNSSFTYQLYGDPGVAFALNSNPPFFKDCSDGQIIALSPTDDPMVNDLKSLFQLYNYDVETYANDQRIDQIIRDKDYGETIPKFCAGVSFQNENGKYNYSLRFNMSSNARSQIPWSNRELTLDEALSLGIYAKSFTSGSMGLTTMINNLILQNQTGSTSNVLLNKMAPIYQQEYTFDGIYAYLSGSFDFLVLLPLLIIYARQTSAMLEEKQKRIRESMSIMGMSTPIYYGTWFLRYFCIYLVVHLINSAIISSQLPHVPYYIPLIVFLLFDILLIVQSFFIQVFVTSSKIGIIISILFFILQYAISFIVSSSQNPSIEINTAVSVVAHVAYGFAFKTMLYAQSNKIDLTFGEELNHYAVSIAVISIIINIMFWGILTWYLEQVFPNEFGAKKHPCFCCVDKRGTAKVADKSQQSQKSFEQNQRKESAAKSRPSALTQSRMQFVEKQNRIEKKVSVIDDPAEVESVEGKYKEMAENNRAIKIVNLNKNFGDFQAVKNLSMNIYSDQIFVLLGHNGAGKTTTISMITGMLDPTSGMIDVCGQTSVQQIRKMIGICPQHDTLYDDLTVEEHIYLFGTFKGLQGQDLEAEIQKLIRDVNLQEKRDQYAKNLSGGQKRRLSVALAFSGGSKVIVLDEPTSGMDTSARRYIWEMLKNYKNDRIILLTTHFMDEADYLGDRIAIMAGGKLVALGSNIFLKNKYGVGYNITFVKKSIDVSSESILSVIKKHIPSCNVLSDVSAQLGVQLPMDQIKQFPSLFQEIDSGKDRLGIQSYGISITTLEQVFLKVGENEEGNGDNEEDDPLIQKIELKPNKEKMLQEEKEKQLDKDLENIQKLDRQDGICERFWSHLGATILKRLRVIKRDLKSFAFELILPIVIIILALQLMTVNFISDYPNQQLSYRTYLSETNPVYLPISAQNSALLDNMQAQIEEVYGSSIKIQQFVAASDAVFDEDELFREKKVLPTLKGGIYYEPTYPVLGGAKTLLPYTSIVNTKSPTSILTVQTLGAETYINQFANKNISIYINNYPFPRTYKQLEINNSISGFFGALIFSLALAFKFASIVAFIVKQRVDKGKHQQIVCGMNIGSYWTGNFVYDYMLYAIVAGFSVGMCVALQIQALVEGDALAATALLFFLLGLANIPFTYILSNLFISYGNAQGIIYFFNFICGGVLPIITLMLRWINNGDSASVGEGISWPLRLIPAFAFGQGMINMGSLQLLNGAVSDEEEAQIFDLNITLASIIFLSFTTVLYTLIVFIIESLQNNENFMRFFTSESQIDETQQIDDDDVLDEQKKALQASPNAYEILTQKLRKVYMVDSEKKYKVAVDNLSFGIGKGEVFGLLGVNGAGKTTTFKMLAGEIVSTSGDSFFCGMKISQNLSKIRKNLGYCPQFDALVENLTVKEQLELYYDLKCLPSKYKQRAIEKKIIEMGLEEYTDKLSGTLSGGNKRKLSVAMAMIGNPSIIFLDEPSTGMDPKARRFMWKIISRISTEKKQSTVILTTHSMEEAEALATRIGIMVRGNFKCIGTPQHIKSKFGKGFEIEIKIKNIKRTEIDEERARVNMSAQLQFSNSQLQELLTKLGASQKVKKEISKEGSASYIWQQLNKRHKASVNSVIQFCLIESKVQKLQDELNKLVGEVQIIENFQTFVRFKTGTSITAGKLFEILEKGKQNLSILQYSIKQASVEQIFNKFADEEGVEMMD